MAVQIPDILARIVERKRVELAAKTVRASSFEEGARQRNGRDFTVALTSRTPAIIAEIKKASPSKGLLSADFRPAQQARDYESGGAAALSVLTDGDFFQGSLDHLQEARGSVALPVLRKDFTIDELDVVEAAAHGADAILLIAAALTLSQMKAFEILAHKLGMAVLVEVHDEAELESALQLSTPLIGINNRNLRTFEVSLQTTLDLLVHIAESKKGRGRIVVTESGIFTAQDVKLMRDHDVHGFLVGEAFMRADDPGVELAKVFS